MQKLRIAVGASPNAMEPGAELRLVKAAMLYADEVKLHSFLISALTSVTSLSDLSTVQQFQAMAQFAESMGQSENALKFYSAAQNYELVNREHRRKLDHEMAPAWRQYRKAARDLLKRFNAEEIHTAIRQGLIDLADLDVTAVGIMEETLRRHSDGNQHTGSSDQQVTQYIAGVLEAVNDPFTYPLLDSQTSRVIDAGVREGAFSVSKTSAAKGVHVALASDLLHRLPILDSASISELIDVRRQLHEPLIRFRSGMIRLSRLINSAPWNRDFLTEARLITHEQIEPAVVELEDQIRHNSYLRQLANKTISDPVALGSVLGIAMSSQQEFINGTLSSAALLGLAAAKAWQAEQARKLEERSATHNQLYFYVRVKQI